MILAVAGIRLGVHISISAGFARVPDEAKELGCNTFQVFTRNPRGWRSTPLKEDDVIEFREKVRQYDEIPVAHASYLPNLASPKDDIWRLSLTSVIDELKRCGELGIPYFVLHMGSHLGAGFEVGFKRLVEGCDQALKKADNNVILLLENMAGQKNSMGSRFEDIGRVLRAIEYQDRIGMCLDSCHAFQAGFDYRSRRGLKKMLQELDRHVGIARVKVLHLNDAENAVGSGLDRHYHIGLGYIGEEGFRNLLHVEEFRGLPWILETPVDKTRGWKENLEAVRRFAE
jgi:deoxyribonuclease-4